MPSEDLLVKCMHCGLCLPTCPTYALTGLEKSSPRGRIRLMKAVAEGDLEITQGFIEEMNFCLDCQACETACPAGVKYGALVESARAQISQEGRENWQTKIVKWIFLRKTFENRKWLAIAAQLMRYYQRSGLDWFLKKTKLLRIFSKRLHEIQYLAPRIASIPSRKKLAERSVLSRKQRFRVGFLTGCIMDVAFSDVNVDTVELLLQHDCEVLIPPLQCCCGSLHAHNGDMETARRLARQNVECFGDLELDAIVMNSAGCGAFMKEYASVLSDDAKYAAPAAHMSKKVKDISEFLFEIGLKLNASSGAQIKSQRVTYHDPCHLAHSQKVSEQPRQLIKMIPTIEYVELPEANWCCGSAGVYNITHYEAATELLDRKMKNIRKVNPDIIVTGNPGCLLQLQYGLSREGMDVEILHLATFLRRICCE